MSRFVSVRRAGLFLFLGLLLWLEASPSFSQELHFESIPPGAQIYLRKGSGDLGTLIGRGGDRIPLQKIVDLLGEGYDDEKFFYLKFIPTGSHGKRRLPEVLPVNLSLLKEQKEWVVTLNSRLVSLKLEVEPPDTKVFVRGSGDNRNSPGQFIGRAQDILILDLDKGFTDMGEAVPIALLLEREGYRTREIELSTPNLKRYGGGSYQLEEPVVLQGKSGFRNRWIQIKNWARFHYYQFFSLISIVLLVVVTLRLRYQQKEAKILAQQKRLDLLDGLSSRLDDSDPYVMRVIGSYRILERVGAGGMAVVYRAVMDESLDEERPVAIKLMSQELLKNADYRRRFEREIRIYCNLNHRNLIRLIDWGEQDNLLFVVMDLVEGKTLKEMLLEKPFSLSDFIKIFKGVCEGLHYVHQQGIIHRDLKPANVMLHEGRVVKIMDLGLAKVSHESEGLTRTGDALGTPAYMSPEQISGGAVSPKTDQYAAGMMAFEMLTQNLPFLVPYEPLKLIMAHLQQEPVSLRHFRPDIPEEVNLWMQKVLSKDPVERYPDMLACYKGLEAAVLYSSSSSYPI